mgnify:CR=1 FL=1
MHTHTCYFLVRYGFVEDALIAYVQAMDNGEELWSKIRQTAGATHKSVNFHHAYSDEHTLGMIGAATKVLGISVEECLRQIGLFQVQVLVEKGYVAPNHSLTHTCMYTCYDCVCLPSVMQLAKPTFALKHPAAYDDDG